jgi:hypothetical protein
MLRKPDECIQCWENKGFDGIIPRTALLLSTDTIFTSPLEGGPQFSNKLTAHFALHRLSSDCRCSKWNTFWKVEVDN